MTTWVSYREGSRVESGGIFSNARQHYAVRVPGTQGHTDSPDLKERHK
jgi:hypothetical protein